MNPGYAALRLQRDQEAQACRVCDHCQHKLPPGASKRRKYCSEGCKAAAWEAIRQPRPKRLRADYHRNYQRMRRAEAQKEEK